jgi:transcriptional regulator with XRE-family HTH domain
MTIYDRIKELRKERKLTQIELAKGIGYSQATIADWERGIIRPTWEAVIKLADYFDVSADYLLGRKEY